MSETSDLADIANNTRLSPNKKLLIMEQLKVGRSLVDVMEEIAVTDANEIKTMKAKSSNLRCHKKCKVLVAQGVGPDSLCRARAWSRRGLRGRSAARERWDVERR